MAHQIASEQWIAGFRDAYRGENSFALVDDDPSYEAGRLAGASLRDAHEGAVGGAARFRSGEGLEGFHQGYRGLRNPRVATPDYQEAFAEGCALRAEHDQALEQALIEGPPR